MNRFIKIESLNSGAKEQKNSVQCTLYPLFLLIHIKEMRIFVFLNMFFVA